MDLISVIFYWLGWGGRVEHRGAVYCKVELAHADPSRFPHGRAGLTID